MWGNVLSLMGYICQTSNEQIRFIKNEDHYSQSFFKKEEGGILKKKKKKQTTQGIQWLNEIFHLIQGKWNRKDNYLYLISPSEVWK